MLQKMLFFMAIVFVMHIHSGESSAWQNQYWSNNYEQYFNEENTFIECIDSEFNHNTRMERLIKQDLDMPADMMRNTDFYYNYVDLNHDGEDEIFALVVGPYTSGSGGSTAFIIEESRHRMEIKQRITLVNVPIIISESMTNGYQDIIVRNFGGGVKGRYVVLTYQDGLYTDVNEGYEITDLKDVSGLAILCDK